MKCVSSCFSCLCGSRTPTRVTPADPIQIIQAHANGVKHGSQVHTSSSESGGTLNPNFSMGEDHGSEGVDGQQPMTSRKVKALFVEVGKDRLLRVIHIQSSEDEDTTSTKASSIKDTKSSEDDQQSEQDKASQSSPVNEDHADEGGGGDDDEEEYWFSKWAQKPHFRNIFSKNSDSRPRLSENNNNPEEGSKISAEMEMARAAAAAKRRAWAYNNNGNCESTITHQPTVTLSEEEEFNSIAIVNSNKQQWTKGSSESIAMKEDDVSNTSSTVQVQVAVETHSQSDASLKNGIANPAFQEDEEEDAGDSRKSEHKTEKEPEVPTETVSSPPVAQGKASGSNFQGEEDAITSDLQEQHPGKNKGSTPPPSTTSNSESVVSSETIAPTTPKKPLLFFIHSIAGSSDVWHKQMEFFQQLGYEVVAPDLLGHGLSSTPLNPKYYYFESLVQDLILIFDHFTKEDMKVVLVGHGYGACLAAMLTRVRIKSVALLITIAGGGPTPLVRRTCCQDSWLSWKCKLFHSNRIRGRFDNPELKHVLPSSIHENILSGQVWGDGDSAFYRRVTVPTLLVYGMRDKVVTLVEECEMERTIPKSFLELIDSAGHMVMLDEPQKLNKMLCKFIQSWS